MATHDFKPVKPIELQPELATELYGLGTYILSPCGSRITCDPPVMDTDEDWLVVHYGRRTDELRDLLVRQGWEAESTDYDSSYFASWRKGRVNLLVTSDQVWADRHRAATMLCRRLNLMDKADRIALFRAVLYSEFCSPRPPRPQCNVCRGSGSDNQMNDCRTCGGSGVV